MTPGPFINSEAEGIPCVWEDETIPQRKRRSEASRAESASATGERGRQHA